LFHFYNKKKKKTIVQRRELTAHLVALSASLGPATWRKAALVFAQELSIRGDLHTASEASEFKKNKYFEF
jgi:hypothetical protein